jgi:hypothetical protein
MAAPDARYRRGVLLAVVNDRVGNRLLNVAELIGFVADFLVVTLKAPALVHARDAGVFKLSHHAPSGHSANAFRGAGEVATAAFLRI